MVDKFEDHCWQDLVTEEIMDIYKPYRREIFVGERPALLAIDLSTSPTGAAPSRCTRWSRNTRAPAA